jgi:hypothetical protein
MGTINSSNRIAATLYSLGTWFVYINTLHKGDSIFTNNNNNKNTIIHYLIHSFIAYSTVLPAIQTIKSIWCIKLIMNWEGHQYTCGLFPVLSWHRLKKTSKELS